MSLRYSNHKLVDGYGAWLQTYDWDLFGTLTFDPGCSLHSSGSREKTLNTYLGSLERHYRRRIRCFWSEENRWSGCGVPGIAPHFHVLLACDRHPLLPDCPKHLWEDLAGIADMRIYDPSLNGAIYCAKLIGLRHAHYGFHNLTQSTSRTTVSKDLPRTVDVVPVN